MKINKILFVLAIGLLAIINLNAQSLILKSALSVSGSADAFREGYAFSYVGAGTPWNGALISFGGLNNRYDCQINTDYGPNGGNRISFRTRNGDYNNGAGIWNSWNELATRGVNTFVGNQIINGNVGIGNRTPNSRLDLGSGS